MLSAERQHEAVAAAHDPNLVGCAGLHDLLGGHLSVDSPHAAARSAGVVAGMLAGTDSIDDLSVLRHGGMPRLFGGIRAPSTIGTYLRSLAHGHVRQLDAVASRLLAGLVARVPGLIRGGDDPDGIAFLDLDDTIREASRLRKAGPLPAATARCSG